MTVMTNTVLIILGLAGGSFVNALVWRIKQQESASKLTKKVGKHSVNLSIVNGRSVCANCGHELGFWDLIPVVSWVYLRGRCRYCRKPIEDSPVIEGVTAAAFILSYAAWPLSLNTASEWAVLALWLLIAVGLVALAVYDLKHLILPNRIIFPLMGVAVVLRIAQLVVFDQDLSSELADVGLGLLVGGGIFYALFQLSNGRWIGGGDVKLGYLIGITLGPADALVALLSAFYVAAIVILPLMLLKVVNRKSKIPFGPFLIVGFFLAMLWAGDIRNYYDSLFGL